jgi:DNA-binding response OmpR family regulator
MITSATATSELPVNPAHRTEKRIPAHPVTTFPHLLIISDDASRAAGIQSMFDNGKVEVSCVPASITSTAISEKAPDVAIVDVGDEEIIEVLKTLRSSAGCETISVLVEASRLADHKVLRGVLPAYRAMPCSPGDLIQLARKRLKNFLGKSRESRKML